MKDMTGSTKNTYKQLARSYSLIQLNFAAFSWRVPVYKRYIQMSWDASDFVLWLPIAWIYGGAKWVDGMYMGIMGTMAYDMLITLASSSGVTATIQDNKQKQLFWVKQNWWSNCDKICTVTLKAWEGKRHLLWPFWSEEQIIAEMRRPWRSVRKKWRMCNENRHVTCESKIDQMKYHTSGSSVWPFLKFLSDLYRLSQGLSDLHLGDQNATWKKLEGNILRNLIFPTTCGTPPKFKA